MTEPPAPRNWSHRLLWLVLGLAVGLNVAAAALLTTWQLPLGATRSGSGPCGVTFVPLMPHTLPGATLLIVAGLVALDTLRYGKTPRRRTCAIMVLCLTLCSGSLMLCTMLDETDFPFRASAAVLGDMSMGYYTQATHVDNLRDYVRNVPGRARLGAGA